MLRSDAVEREESSFVSWVDVALETNGLVDADIAGAVPSLTRRTVEAPSVMTGTAPRAGMNRPHAGGVASNMAF